MKSLYFISIFSLIAFASGAQLKDTIFYDIKQNDIWQKVSLNELTYNNNCVVTQRLDKVWDESAQSWSNSTLYSYQYDSGGHKSKEIQSYWNASTNMWTYYSRYLILTDDGLLKTFLLQQWGSFVNDWVNVSKQTYNYDENGNMLSQLIEHFDNDVWQNSLRSLLNYNAKGEKTESKIQVWRTDEWVNAASKTYKYAEEGLKITTIDYTWDAIAGQWEAIFKNASIYETETFHLLNNFSRIFDNNVLLYKVVENFIYNESGLEVANHNKYKDMNSQNWIPYYNILQDYFHDDAQKNYLYEEWDTITNTWATGYRFTYTNNGCDLKAAVVASDIKERASFKSLSKTVKKLNLSTNQLAIDIPYYQKTLQKSNLPNPKQLVISVKKKGRSLGENSKSEFKLSSNSKNPLSISPNPTSSYADISFIASTQADYSIKLYDMQGRLLQAKTGVSVAGRNNVRLHIGNITKGMYLVRVTCGNQTYLSKLVKQ